MEKIHVCHVFSITEIEHRKIEPIRSTSSHCKINRSSWPNKTQILENKYEAIINHVYKRSKKTQITFMDKNIDLIINSKFIGSQQTHRKKSYIIWISKRPLY